MFCFFLDRKLKFNLFEFNFVFAIIYSLFAYQLLIFIFGEYPSTQKTYMSGLLIVIVVLSLLFFASALKNIGHLHLTKVLSVVTVISLFIGFSSFVFDITFLNYDRFAKSVFPYAEPSHYAISVCPVLFSTGFLVSERARVIMTLSVYCLALLFPSVILLVYAVLMTFFYFNKNFLKALVLNVIVIVLLYFIQLSEVGLYFTDRLSLSADSANLTSLVYLQGWADMVISLENSGYLGVGFQNMGILAPSVYGETIYALAGDYKNREDGGFLAAKIVAEFGVLGVIIILFYLKYFFRSINLLWHCVRHVGFKQHSVLLFSNRTYSPESRACC